MMNEEQTEEFTIRAQKVVDKLTRVLEPESMIESLYALMTVFVGSVVAANIPKNEIMAMFSSHYDGISVIKKAFDDPETRKTLEKARDEFDAKVKAGEL